MSFLAARFRRDALVKLIDERIEAAFCELGDTFTRQTLDSIREHKDRLAQRVESQAPRLEDASSRSESLDIEPAVDAVDLLGEVVDQNRGHSVADSPHGLAPSRDGEGSVERSGGASRAAGPAQSSVPVVGGGARTASDPPAGQEEVSASVGASSALPSVRPGAVTPPGPDATSVPTIRKP